MLDPVDRDSFEAILAIPWLKNSVQPTGHKWGRRIADVTISPFPTSLAGQALLIEEEGGFTPAVVRLVVYRCDRYDHLGWADAFTVLLTFPDSSQYEVEVPPSHRLVDGHSTIVSLSPGTLLRQRSQQGERRIPRVVFNLSAPATKQISQDVRRLLKNVRRVTNFLQCTSLYLVLEDDACQHEVEESGIPNFREAYRALIPGAYKADLMRYYLLYKYGGIYLDDKTLLRQSLDSDAFDSVFQNRGEFCDFFISEHRSPEISFMGARRGSPLMLKALQTGIKKILNREYTNHRLGITGNIMFCNMLYSGPPESSANLPSPHPDNEAIWIRYWGEVCAILPIVLSNNGVMLKDGRFLWQRQAISTLDWPNPSNHYKDAWPQRLVYTDGNPTPSVLRTVWHSRIVHVLLHICVAFGLLAIAGFIISRYPSISWI